ncbi:hypothetical protein PV327_011384 [Microctonus hyperodae]|uniref:DUF4371 domain-containing protein n=1 Tax=Microctonus hyperodae TaxID=165561 RepID=A0AA39EXQ6_MICHY|nr:hypothetical protein PV327_011384 [Microctonus hyperodae]
MMDSPMELGLNSMDTEQKTTKRKVFNDTRLTVESFKDWLRRSSNENKAYCSFCEKQSQDLSQNLNDTKFSVLVDESTTTAGDKLLCILVKYIAPNRQLITELFELVNLDASDCSASKLYEAFESSFKQRNVPVTNIVAIASDNAAVMAGKHDSYVTRTRWFSSQKCIARLLENSEPLKNFLM